MPSPCRSTNKTEDLEMDPCVDCGASPRCRREKIACRAFFDYMCYGHARYTPESPNKSYYNKIFSGEESKQPRKKHNMTKRLMTPEQVEAIRLMASEGMYYADIGMKYNIHATTVGQIVRKATYNDY